MRCAYTLFCALLIVLCIVSVASSEEAIRWSQFRGPNASGIADADQHPPTELLPDKNLLWSREVPEGLSSPCIWGEAIFLTAFEKDKKELVVLCLKRSTGEEAWRQVVPAANIERVHGVSSPATGTAATDGKRVYAYFGSFGLIAYDFEGHEQWRVPLSMPETMHGSGTSPAIVDDMVVLNRDDMHEPFLLAVKCDTGETVWKQKLPQGFLMKLPSYSTPVVDGDLLVIHRANEMAAFAKTDGERRWWIQLPSSGTSTPVVGDGEVFVAAWSNFGEPELRVDLPSFADLLKKYDANSDKQISNAEFPDDLAIARRPEVGADVPGAQVYAKPFFDRLDRNKSGTLTSFEWTAVKFMLGTMNKDHGLMAVREGGEKDVTATHVAWKETRGVSEIPSPLIHDGRVYMLKDGGIVTCMDSATGKLVYRERVGGPGAYYASPVLAAGNIYVVSNHGVVTVFKAGDKPDVVSSSDLGEAVYATPAFADQKVYVRTASHLMAFGE